MESREGFLDDCMGRVAQKLAKSLRDLYFNDIQLLNSMRLPNRGGTFVVGKHSNQFMDAIVLLGTLPRIPRFLIADKSLKMPIVGHFARFVRGVGVKRAQDLAFKGRGKIIAIENDKKENNSITEIPPDSHVLKVEGNESTKFHIELKLGDTIKILNHSIKVIRIVSNGVFYGIKLSDADVLNESGLNLQYTVLPKIDQNVVYSKVNTLMGQGGCVAIFPEGGSHDQPKLIPLKAGVAIMALEAAKLTYDVTISPVGIFYLEPSALRSMATVDIGEPIKITKDMVRLYQTNKKEAIETLLDTVKKAIEDVTITAQDRETLKLVKLSRWLYCPDQTRPNRAVCHEVMVIFSKLYEYENECLDQSWLKMREELLLYSKMLQLSGLQDFEVCYINMKLEKFATELFWMTRLFLSNCFTVLLLSPIFGTSLLASHLYAERNRKTALAQSSVKLTADDVVASFRLTIFVIIVPFTSFLMGLLTGMLLYSSYYLISIWTAIWTWKSMRLFETANHVSRS